MNVAIPLLCVPLIYCAAIGFSGILGMLLTRRPLLYIGKISYGIYIYHVPVAYLMNLNGSNWLKHVPLPIPYPLVLLTATVTLAAISWHFFESPINRLKRLFPYREGQYDRKPEPQPPTLTQRMELD